MAKYLLPREPQGDVFFEPATPDVDNQSDDIYASLQAARASAYSHYLATVSATAEATPTVDDGTLVVMQTSTAYVSPTASRYTATSSLLTATDTAAPSLQPSTTISNTNASSATSTTNASSATSTTNSSSATSTPTNARDAEGASQTSPGLTANQHHNHNDGLSTGQLTAAIVLPILAAVALFLLAFFLLRRRAQKTRGRNGSGSSTFLPGLREKWGSLRSSDTSTHHTEMETARGGGPIVTSRENNAYFTGLDTSSHGSGSGHHGHSGEYYASPVRTSEGGTTFDLPPPVYTAKPSSRAPVLPHIDTNSADLRLDRIPTPSPSAHAAQPPPSPLLSPGTASPAMLLATHLDPPQSSARSAVSISSTLYSDTASIHSARAARMSIGGPNVIQPGLHSPRSGTLGDTDPFGNENAASTPVSARSESSDESVVMSGQEAPPLRGPF